MSSNEKELLIEAEKIYKSVLDPDAPEGLFEIRHLGNPFRLSHPFSFSYEDKEPAGVAIFMGMRFIADKKEVVASQAIDCAVLEQYQGRGHFTRAMTEFGRLNSESEFSFGLPNTKSYSPALKLGYVEFMWLCHFIYATSPFSFVFGDNALSRGLDKFYRLFLRLNKEKAGSDEELTFTDDMNVIPVSEKELKEIGQKQKCHFLHNEALYKWKFAYNPDKKFYWATLRKKDGTLLGYGLCHLRPRAKGNFVIIDDFGFSPYCSDPAHALKLIFSRLGKLGDILEIPFVNTEKEGALMKSLHFINACKFPFPLRGGPLVVSPQCRYFEELKSCSFRNIDSDVL